MDVFRITEKTLNSAIVYIIPSLSVGGAEIQTIKHVNYLYKQGHAIFLVVLSNKVPLINDVQLPEKNILLINKTQFEYNFAGIQSAISHLGLIKKFVRRNKIEVVVAVMPLSHFCGRLLKLQQSITNDKSRLIIYHRAAFFDMNPANTTGKKLMKIITQWLSKKYDDHVIYISEHVKQMIETNMVVKCPSSVIYNSSDFPEIPQKEVSEFMRNWGLNERTFFILVPGRLHSAKGQDDLIKAVSILRNKIDLSETKIIIAGDGAYHDVLAQLTEKLNLTEFIQFTGSLGHDLLIGLMQACTWVVIPSRAEGLGNVAIEALMCGANILSSDAGGLKEVVVDGKTGFLFVNGDINDLAEKLERIYTGEISPLPKSGLRSYYQENFSLEKQIVKLLQIIHGADMPR